VKRRLFNLAAAVSVGMMLAMVVLWVRSWWALDGLGLDRPNHVSYSLASSQGHLRLERGVGDPFGAPGGLYRLSAPPVPLLGFGGAPPSISKRLGFEYLDGKQGPFFTKEGRQFFIRVRSQTIPYWFVLMLAGSCATLFWLPAYRRRVRRVRTARGLCPRCGYDLRATPERCPECGTAAGTPSSSSGQAAAFRIDA
jgi:hypothetical protein